MPKTLPELALFGQVIARSFNISRLAGISIVQWRCSRLIRHCTLLRSDSGARRARAASAYWRAETCSSDGLTLRCRATRWHRSMN